MRVRVHYYILFLRQYNVTCLFNHCDDRSFDVAVLIVNDPFPINDYIRPACLPPVEWARNLKGGKMVISGMGRTVPRTVPGSGLSPTLQIATITIKSKMACTLDQNIGSEFKSS